MHIQQSNPCNLLEAIETKKNLPAGAGRFSGSAKAGEHKVRLPGV
jgi:hypothetical protein